MATGYLIKREILPEGAPSKDAFTDEFIDLDKICKLYYPKGSAVYLEDTFKTNLGTNFQFNTKIDDWNMLLPNNYFYKGAPKNLIMRGSFPTLKNKPVYILSGHNDKYIRRSGDSILISDEALESTGIELKKEIFSDKVVPSAIIIAIQAGGGGGGTARKEKHSKKVETGVIITHPSHSDLAAGSETVTKTWYTYSDGSGGGAGAACFVLIDFHKLGDNSIHVHIGRCGQGGNNKNQYVSQSGEYSSLSLLNHRSGEEEFIAYCGGGDPGSMKPEDQQAPGGWGGDVDSCEKDLEDRGIYILREIAGADGGDYNKEGHGCRETIPYTENVNYRNDLSFTFQQYGGECSREGNGGGGGSSPFGRGGAGGRFGVGQNGSSYGAGGGGAALMTSEGPEGYAYGGNGCDGALLIYY